MVSGLGGLDGWWITQFYIFYILPHSLLVLLLESIMQLRFLCWDFGSCVCMFVRKVIGIVIAEQRRRENRANGMDGLCGCRAVVENGSSLV